MDEAWVHLGARRKEPNGQLSLQLTFKEGSKRELAHHVHEEKKRDQAVSLLVKLRIPLHHSPNHLCVQSMASDCRCPRQNCGTIHGNQQRYASALNLAAQNDKYNQNC